MRYFPKSKLKLLKLKQLKSSSIDWANLLLLFISFICFFQNYLSKFLVVSGENLIFAHESQ